MDMESHLLWNYYSHLFPAFTENHLRVYILLWSKEMKSGEKLILGSGLSRGSVYGILRELTAAGLVKKTSAKPMRYFVQNPLSDYSLNSRRAIAKIRQGKKALKEVMSKSGEHESEILFIKAGDGPNRILNKKTRSALTDETRLREIKKAADAQLLELLDKNVRTISVYH